MSETRVQPAPTAEVSPEDPRRHAARSGGKRTTVFEIVLRCMYVTAAAAVLWLVADGLAYYRTPLIERPHHEAYRLLRPAGMRGHTLGIVGSAMLLTLLTYSLRKRSRRLARFGSVSRWLSVHIFLGIFGPLLVTLHTSFRISGLVAVSYWSMVTVAVSGVFGRYLYRQIPRNIVGEEKTERELAQELEAIDRAIGSQCAFGGELVAALERLAGSPDHGGSGRRAALGFLLRRDGRLRREAAAVASRIAGERGIIGGSAAALIALSRDRAVIHRRLALLTGLRQLFHYWHVFHKPFAYLMLIIMLVHIVVSIATGYTWIF